MVIEVMSTVVCFNRGEDLVVEKLERSFLTVSEKKEHLWLVFRFCILFIISFIILFIYLLLKGIGSGRRSIMRSY